MLTDDWDDTVAVDPGSIEPDEGEAYFVVVRGTNVGETYPILGPTMVIGRAAGVDLRLNDEGVSRFHCKLRYEGNRVLIEDLSSRNGTFCNGERVATTQRALVEGDRVQIGTTSVLRFTYVEDLGTATPAPEATLTGVRDALTGTFSRRRFVEQLEHDVELAQTNRRPLSLVLVRIDRFAEICEAHGQTFGDQLTIEVANHIRAMVRDEHLLARIAGGEFGLMSRLTSPGDTFMLAERVRKTTDGLSVPPGDGAKPVTLSLGVASLGELRIERAHDLLVAAGTALHRARSLGGNRAVMCTQELLHEPKHRTRV